MLKQTDFCLGWCRSRLGGPINEPTCFEVGSAHLYFPKPPGCSLCGVWCSMSVKKKKTDPKAYNRPQQSRRKSPKTIVSCYIFGGGGNKKET